MNERQMHNVDLLKATIAYLEANVDIWKSTPIIDTYFGHLTEVVKSLNDSTQDQIGIPELTGSTLHQLRIDVAEKMDILDDILEAYAEDTNNKKLLSESENSKSDYLRLTNDGFERKVASVIQLLEANLEELKPYGIISSDLEKAKSSFEEYQKKRTESPNKALTGDLNEQSQLFVEEGLQIINKLIVVMVRFRNSNSSFYNGFVKVSSLEEMEQDE